MIEKLRNGLARDARTVIISVVASSVVVAVPATAAIVATNSDKVDGKHAVSVGATKAKRAGKLVATGKNGLLPGNIIAEAPDANLLDGKDSTAFLGSTGKAADADKLDGKDASDLVVANGGKYGGYMSVNGCAAAVLVSYPLALDRPARVHVDAYSMAAVFVDGPTPNMSVQLLNGSDTVVAATGRIGTKDLGNPSFAVGGTLFTPGGGAVAYNAPAGSYTLRILAQNQGTCDSTKYTQYQEVRLSHMLLPIT